MTQPTKEKNYEFTLILKNVIDDTPGIEDSLYEAGCDDALINFRNGAVYLDFDRQADSLENAVLSAIRDVESASVGAIVVSVAPEDLVTISEIAKRLSSDRQVVSLWAQGERRVKQRFPGPVMKLSEKSPLWRWAEVAKWSYENKIIDELELVQEAELIEAINAALDERDVVAREKRHDLLNKISGSARWKESHRAC